MNKLLRIKIVLAMKEPTTRSYLSSAMAVILRVDTNTDTDINIGEILHTGLQKLI